MAYTLSDLRNRVITDKLDDESFDTAIVDRFINDTQKDIFNTYELPFMEKVFTGVLPSTEYIFLFPADVQKLQSVKITAPDQTQRDISDLYVPFREFNRRYPTPISNTVSGITCWTLYGGKMFTSAPLDQAYSMDIFYLKKATELADDADIPEVPPEFEEMLVLGAFKRVLERNEDYDLAGVINNQYNDQLDKLVNRLGFRQNFQSTVIQLPRHRTTRRR